MNQGRRSSVSPATDDVALLLRELFDTAVANAQPALRIAEFMPAPAKGRTIVIGAGKASAAMAQAAERHWAAATDGRRPLEGLVVTRYGYAVPCEHIEIIEAAHPVPDEQGLAASRRMLNFVSGLHADDLVICLISGGGSSLLPLPMPGVTLAQKQALNVALLRGGATISEMNCVRRHVSAIKGGRLARAYFPARVVNLIISDVPADAVRDIASGPTVSDPSTCRDAIAILQRYRIDVPETVWEALESGATESAKPGDTDLPDITTHLIATPQQALEAAAQVCRQRGIAAHILGDAIEGEAKDVGLVLAGIARQVRLRGQPFTSPCVLLSGGETTVTVKGSGRGGRNVEFLLSLGIGLAGAEGIHAIAGDTDGVDGQEDIAGAILHPDSLERARAAGIDPRAALANNDGHGFFQAIGDAVVTGPTHTNVNDFRAIYVAESDHLAEGEQ